MSENPFGVHDVKLTQETPIAIKVTLEVPQLAEIAKSISAIAQAMENFTDKFKYKQFR